MLPVSASTLVSNVWFQRPASQGVGGRPATTIRRHRPVSGVSDKRSQHQRTAAFGGLPSLPPGVHPGNQNGSIRSSFSASNFSIIFGVPFFRHFTPFGAPLSPLWLLLNILDAFWMHFGLHFGSLLLHFCFKFAYLFLTLFLHRFYADCSSLFTCPEPRFSL